MRRFCLQCRCDGGLSVHERGQGWQNAIANAFVIAMGRHTLGQKGIKNKKKQVGKKKDAPHQTARGVPGERNITTDVCVVHVGGAARERGRRGQETEGTKGVLLVFVVVLFLCDARESEERGPEVRGKRGCCRNAGGRTNVRDG